MSTREDELLALEAIYDSETFGRDDAKLGGQLRVVLDLKEPIVVVCQQEERSFRHFPPLVIHFELPDDYPEASPPKYTLSSQWLTVEQVTQHKRQKTDKVEPFFVAIQIMLEIGRTLATGRSRSLRMVPISLRIDARRTRNRRRRSNSPKTPDHAHARTKSPERPSNVHVARSCLVDSRRSRRHGNATRLRRGPPRMRRVHGNEKRHAIDSNSPVQSRLLSRVRQGLFRVFNPTGCRGLALLSRHRLQIDDGSEHRQGTRRTGALLAIRSPSPSRISRRNVGRRLLSACHVPMRGDLRRGARDDGRLHALHLRLLRPVRARVARRRAVPIESRRIATRQDGVRGGGDRGAARLRRAKVR